MALIPASINITFNANYTGCHRICWRLVGAPTYDCSTQPICAGGGAPCSAVIGITVDDASCVPTTFEGYVQACCEDPLSLIGRVPFTVTYTPASTCPGYTITCTGPVSIQKIVVSAPGGGYVPGATIPVTIVPALGGAAANAIIGDGGVSDQFSSIAPSVFGAGYANGTWINVPGLTLTGIGTGALFTVTTLGGVVIQVDVKPGFNGVNYAFGDTLNFNNALIGGGVGAVAAVYIINTGEVQNVVLVNPGSGYSTPPVCTIPPGATGQGTIGAVLGLCPVLDLNSCGGFGDPIQGVPAGTSFVACASTPFVLPPQYTITPGQCCNTCNTVTFDKPQSYTNPPARLYWTDCVTKKIVMTIITNGANVVACAVTGSWFVQESDPVNGSTLITVGPPCP